MRYTSRQGQKRKRERKSNFSQKIHPTLSRLKSMKGSRVTTSNRHQGHKQRVFLFQLTTSTVNLCPYVDNYRALCHQLRVHLTKNVCQSLILPMQTQHFQRTEIRQVQLNPRETRKKTDGPPSCTVGCSSGLLKLLTSEHEKAGLYEKCCI